MDGGALPLGHRPRKVPAGKSPFSVPVELPTEPQAVARRTRRGRPAKAKSQQSLSQQYGSRYDEAAVATGTATARGVEMTQALETRDLDGEAHEKFLALTHDELQSHLAKRDELIELLGYNPVQEAAASTIQAVARHKFAHSPAGL